MSFLLPFETEKKAKKLSHRSTKFCFVFIENVNNTQSNLHFAGNEQKMSIQPCYQTTVLFELKLFKLSNK